MASKVLLFVLSSTWVFTVCSGRTGQFDPVRGDNCPMTEAKWQQQASNRNCPVGTKYHCVSNQHGDFGEVCVKESWVQPGYCPEFNTEAKKINVKECRPFDTYRCPVEAFHSHQAFKHIICLKTPPVPTTTPATTTISTEKQKTPEESGGSAAVPVVIVLFFLLIIGGFLVLVFLMRRNEGYIPGTKTKIPYLSNLIYRGEEETNDPETQPMTQPAEEKQPPTPPPPIHRSNPYFVETQCYNDLITELEKHQVVLVTGNTGIGKTTTCIAVLEYFNQRSKWNTIDLNASEETNVDFESKTVVLVDCCLGNLKVYAMYSAKISNALNQILKLITDKKKKKQIKLLITSESSLSDGMKNAIPIIKYSKCKEYKLQKERFSEQEIIRIAESHSEIKEFKPSDEKEENITDSRSVKVEEETGSTQKLAEHETNTMATNLAGENIETNITESDTDCANVNDQQNISEIRKQKEGETRHNRNKITELKPTAPVMSRFGLPVVCYIKGTGKENHITDDDDAVAILEHKITELAKSRHQWEKQRYLTLVEMMLNGSALGNVNFSAGTKSKSGLTPDEIFKHTLEFTQEGLFMERGQTYTFSNEIILLVVVKHYAMFQTKDFITLADYPFIVQFLRPKEPRDSTRAFLVEVPDSLEYYCTIDERSFAEGHYSNFKEHDLFTRFNKLLSIHEKAAEEKARIIKHKKSIRHKDPTQKEILRKMIQYHPFLKEYYRRTKADVIKGLTVEELQFKGHLLDCCKQELNTVPAQSAS